MRNFLSIFLFFLAAVALQAQELNATVTVDAQQTGKSDQQIFKTLESQLTEFLSNTKWTSKEYKNQERIDCNFSLIIDKYDGTSFSGTLQVQASRPVFNSSYNTPIYNYNDKDFAFNYKEFEPLNFNINRYESNLVSILTFHVFTIIGLDADTFALNGGASYFEIVKQIVNTAASGNNSGWKVTDGTQSRYRYNDALVSNVYEEFHTAMYQYHREGLDLMASDPATAKSNIAGSISTLKSINDRRPNSFLLRTFFDAKSDEIQAIFSGGPKVDITTLLDNLTSIAPTKRSNWSEIKY